MHPFCPSSGVLYLLSALVSFMQVFDDRFQEESEKGNPHTFPIAKLVLRYATSSGIIPSHKIHRNVQL
jgi:hypothetical protein